MFTRIRDGLVVSCCCMLVACGGGSDPTSSNGTNSSDPKQGVNSLEVTGMTRSDAALNRGLDKTIYTVSNNLGAYGKTLDQDAYKFKITTLDKLPTASSTILYLNASDLVMATPEQIASVQNFKGVLIIDSDLIDNSQLGAAADIAIEKNSQVSYPATDFYASLSQGKATQVPLGTALITSATANSLMGISVDSTGGINGSSADTRQTLINPLMVALSNLEINEGLIQPSKTRTQALGSNNNSDRVNAAAVGGPPGGWDRVVDFGKVDRGWNMYGRVYVEALKESSGNRHFLAVEVATGDNQTACMVSGINCGIYPQRTDNIVYTDSTGGGLNTMINAWGPARTYAASVIAIPAVSVLEYAPSMQAWTSEAAKESDTFETVWSEGYSIGGSAGPSTAGSFSVSLSAAYSRATTYRKKTYLWDSFAGTSREPNGLTKAWTGIKNINHANRYSNTPSYEEFLHPSVRLDSYGAKGRQRMRDAWLNGGFAQGSLYGNNAGNRNSPYVRPRMSYTGWNPAISVTFEVPAARIMANNASSFVDVVGQIHLEREKMAFKRTNRLLVSGRGGWTTTDAWGYAASPSDPDFNSWVGPWAGGEPANAASATVRIYRASWYN